jgi:hypothetical protein
MNKFLTSALAIAVAGPAASAGTGDSDWLKLDSEINGLASSLSAPNGSGATVTALFRAFYVHSKDEVGTSGGDDISGFASKDVDVAVTYAVGDVGGRISTDIEDNISEGNGDDIDIEDAFVWAKCMTDVTSSFGLMQPKSLFGTNVDPGRQLLAERTVVASSWDFRDAGLGFNWSRDQLSVDFQIFNGSDEFETDHAFVVRLIWMINQGAAAMATMGALGANDDWNGAFGLTYQKDNSTDDDDHEIMAIDYVGTMMGRWSLNAEVVDMGEDAGGGSGDDFGVPFNTFIPLDGDTTPWNFTLGYLLNNDWEVALRHEDTDNADDTSITSLGANYYMSGHTAKAQAQISSFDSDDTFQDGTIVKIGLSIGQSR